MTRRRLSSEERALWRAAMRNTAPLRKPDVATSDDLEPAAPRPSPTPRAKREVGAPSKPAPRPVPPPVPIKPAAPQPVPLGRRLRLKLSRGSRTIDGRLDLHGMTQAQAHGALLGFLHAMQARGGKVVLVITGKGVAGSSASGLSERGVLKRQVPLWLRLPEFHRYVTGFETAGVGHGGDGALYVTLRRPRGD